MHLIEVAFKGNRKEFYHWSADEPPPLKAAVIVDADRGEDLGVVHATGELAQQRFDGAAHGVALGPVTKEARRLATPEDVGRAKELRGAHDEDARRRGMERVKAHGLVMKLTDAEWQWDRKKLTFYFTAEKRVDFRALVRDLAAAFRTRIELKQIGVRDEAKRLDGIGRCGRQYCSASWLPELRPVNLAVAKDQKLSLNPLQISGACGRLMCCLRYEHEFYVQSRKRFPKEGRILVTTLGEEKVVANDIFNDRVTLRNPEGDVRVVPLAELKREIAAGAEGASAERERVASADASETAAADATDVTTAAPERRRRALPVRDRLPGTPRNSRPSSRPRDAERPQRGPAPGRGQTVADDDGRDELAVPRPPAAGARPVDLPLTDPDAVADAVADAPLPGALDPALDGAPPAVDGMPGAEATSGAEGAPGGEERRRRRRGRRGGRRSRGADRGASRDSSSLSDDASGPEANGAGPDAAPRERSTDQGE